MVLGCSSSHQVSLLLVDLSGHYDHLPHRPVPSCLSSTMILTLTPEFGTEGSCAESKLVTVTL